MPKAGEAFRCFHSIRPNDASVVLQLRFEGLSLLLGGDLENVPNDGSGWRAVLLSSHHGGLKSEAFKIAHHGSEGADHPDVWSSMVAEDSVSLLTPFGKGAKATTNHRGRKTNQISIGSLIHNCVSAL